MVKSRNIAVIITSHNRAQITLRCLNSLYSSYIPREFAITVYLTDDGSTDGTSKLIREKFPKTVILEGDGHLYWNRGMFKSWKYALKHKHDFYLLLNDDVELAKDSIYNLLCLYNESSKNSVIVGRTIDPVSMQTTYGALKRKSRISKNSFVPVANQQDVAVSFNANCVLIPHRGAWDVGILDPFYTQQFGDIDLGLRFYKNGWNIVQCEDPVALLEKNFAYSHLSYEFSYKSFKELLLDPKGIPAREWWYFLKKFNGISAIFYFLYRYLKLLTFGFGNMMRKRDKF